MDLQEFLKELDEASKEKTFRNWINNRFPKGYGSYNSYYILTHPWEILREWKRQIKWAWQRVFRGWDDTAIFSVDYYLSKLIVDIMKDYMKFTNGIPVSFYAELGLEEETFENGVIGYSQKSMDIADKEWKNRLNKIITGFEAYIERDDFSPYRDKEKYDELSKQFEEGFDLLKKYYSGLWT